MLTGDGQQWDAHFEEWIETLTRIRHDCIENKLWPERMNSANHSTHDMIVALDAEMTDIDLGRGRIMEIGAAVLTSDLIPQASLHIVVRADTSTEETAHCRGAELSPWSAVHHRRPRYYECNASLVELCACSSVSIEKADRELHAFLRVFQGDSGQLMSLCGNSVWRDYLFIQKFMPLTCSMLHHRVIDCSGARELAKRHCHIANASINIRPPRPLDAHCAMYDALDAINFMRWHAHVTTHGLTALQNDSKLNSAFVPAVLPVHAHRRIGFELVALKCADPELECAPFILMPHNCDCYVPEAMNKLLHAQQQQHKHKAGQVHHHHHKHRRRGDQVVVVSAGDGHRDGAHAVAVAASVASVASVGAGGAAATAGSAAGAALTLSETEAAEELKGKRHKKQQQQQQHRMGDGDGIEVQQVQQQEQEGAVAGEVKAVAGRHEGDTDMEDTHSTASSSALSWAERIKSKTQSCRSGPHGHKPRSPAQQQSWSARGALSTDEHRARPPGACQDVSWNDSTGIHEALPSASAPHKSRSVQAAVHATRHESVHHLFATQHGAVKEGLLTFRCLFSSA